MLSDKIAVITGAAGGIGLACLDLFCENHAEVYAFVRQNRPEFSEHVSELINRGAAVHIIECDMSSEAGIKEAVKSLTKATKKVDILVNNAGVMPESSAFQMKSADKIKQTFEVNFFGPITLTQYIFRTMSRNKSGSIVNVASLAAIDGVGSGIFEYCSSKAAMIGATKELAIELGAMGVRVNAVAPGIVKTKMADGLKMSEEEHKDMLAHCVMKRYAEPEEIANAILFLASDMSSYITGQVIIADGGLFR